MVQDNWKEIFSQQNLTASEPMPELVKERLELTYQDILLGSLDNGSTDRPLTIKSKQRRTAAPLHQRIKSKLKEHGKHTYFMVAGVAVASAIVISVSSAFVSPVMASSLRHIPILSSIFALAGDMGLRTADQNGMAVPTNSQDDHDGIRLAMPQVMYDGTRVSFSIQRIVGDTAGTLAPIMGYTLDETGNVKDSKTDDAKGAISEINLYIDDQPLQSSESVDGDSGLSGLFGRPGADANSAIYQLIVKDLSEPHVLSDPFTLKVVIKLKGIDQPYELTSTVQADRRQAALQQVNEHKQLGDVEFGVRQIEHTPATLTIVTSSRQLPGSYPIDQQYWSKIKQGLTAYDVVDDQGRSYHLIAGEGRALSMKTQFEPLQDDVQWIMLKPYRYTSTDPVTGLAAVDEQGQPLLTYYPELNIKIQIQ